MPSTESGSMPVVLELAPLPREQVGPFLLLGVSKTADKERIEACWAQRLIWARKNQIATPLEDINWAREMLSDPEKRERADAASLNLDTSEQILEKLRVRYSGGDPGCRPLDVEKSLADHSPPIAVPHPAEVRQAIPAGNVPLEVPAVVKLLEQFAQQPMDPWDDAVNG